MPEHILFITCSSGHGHMAATLNIQADIAAKNPDVCFHMLDIVNYLYPVKPIIVDLWNAGIRQDSMIAHLLPRVNGYYEFFYERFLEKKLVGDLHVLFETFPITQIVDTQPIFTPLLVKQMAKASSSPITYHKVLTDLPVNAHHPFFPGIKKRGHFDNLHFYLHGATPLIQPPHTETEFWKNHCNVLPEQLGTLWSKPVHNAFKSLPDNRNSVTVHINTKLAAHLELHPVNDVLILPENAQVTTLMMGSQGLEVIHAYYKKIRRVYSGKSLTVPHYIFIACSRNESLYQDLLQQCMQTSQGNDYLKIVPLEMQPPENVASLMWRSQTIIMRASGLTCIEQLAMNETALNAGIDFHPKRFIHSHCKKPLPVHASPEAQSEFLLKHSVGHEKANTIYLQQKLGAVLTRVDIIPLD